MIRKSEYLFRLHRLRVNIVNNGLTVGAIFSNRGAHKLTIDINAFGVEHSAFA
jgi:hypothetical protein